LYNSGEANSGAATVAIAWPNDSLGPPHGILEIGSAYENTGTIIRQLGDSKPNTIPILNLVFDGSDQNGNNELMRNFLHYIILIRDLAPFEMKIYNRLYRKPEHSNNREPF